MNFPIQITIGNVTVPLHAVAELAGMFIGFRYFSYLRKKQGDTITSSNRTWIIVGAIFGAIVGSRLIGGLENPYTLSNSSNVFLHFYSNKTVVGGFLGGLLGVELIKKVIYEPQSSGDLFTYPMILALMIGRIGCFSMGVYEETYGMETTLPWGMDLGDGILRHPVTLYEILFLILLWLLLVQLGKRHTFVVGAKFKLFMMTYLLFRFVLDFIKPHHTFGIGLSTIQITCLLGLMYYSRYIIHPKLLLTDGSLVHDGCEARNDAVREKR